MDTETFKTIFMPFRHKLFGIALRLTGNSEDAEDAVQEAFLALTRHLDKVEDVYSPRTKRFLSTIVRSKAVDILRKREPEQELEDCMEDGRGGTDILEQYLRKEQYNQLVSCVLELDDRYRTVFEYKYLYQMTDAEIGDILGISAKNVNVRYFRARKKLQEMIRKEGGRYEKA